MDWHLDVEVNNPERINKIIGIIERETFFLFLVVLTFKTGLFKKKKKTGLDERKYKILIITGTELFQILA